MIQMMQRNCLRHWVLFWYLLITRCIGSRYWIFGFTMTILQIWCQALNCLRLAPTTLMKSSLALAWRTLDALTASSSKCNVCWPQSRSRVIFPLSLMQLENESPTSKEHWSNTQLPSCNMEAIWKGVPHHCSQVTTAQLERCWANSRDSLALAFGLLHQRRWMRRVEHGKWLSFCFWSSTCKSSIHPVRSFFAEFFGPGIFQVVSKKPGFCLFSSLFPSRSIWAPPGAVDQGRLLLYLWQGWSPHRDARMLPLHGQPGFLSASSENLGSSSLDFSGFSDFLGLGWNRNEPTWQARVADNATVVSTSTRNFPNRLGKGNCLS